MELGLGLEHFLAGKPVTSEMLPMLDFYVQGYLGCSKNKKGSKEWLDYTMNLCQNLIDERTAILFGKYHPGLLRAFLVDQPVLREIFAPIFSDRVDHHYIASRLEPLFEKQLIYDCYACRKGKGTGFGVQRLSKMIARCSESYSKPCYVLLGDLSGYFMSIDRVKLWDRLEAFLRQKYHGDDLEHLLYQTYLFIFSISLEHIDIRGRRQDWQDLPDNKSMFVAMGSEKPNVHKGDYTSEDARLLMALIIGALPSQMLSNFYLDPFDKYCVHTLKVGFYGRYVDDFFIVGNDKEQLLAWSVQIRAFLKEMGLTLHPDKVRVIDYQVGVPFLGAFIRRGVVLPGKRIRGNFKHLLDEIETLPTDMRYSDEIEHYAGRVNSYLGLLRQYHAFHFTRRMFDCHPRLKLFFKWNPDTLEKVISRQRIDALVCRSVNKEAARLFHSQFRRGNRRAILSRADCYRQVYLRRYGILIPVAVERHPVYRKRACHDRGFSG